MKTIYVICRLDWDRKELLEAYTSRQLAEAACLEKEQLDAEKEWDYIVTPLEVKDAIRSAD